MTVSSRIRELKAVEEKSRKAADAERKALEKKQEEQQNDQASITYSEHSDESQAKT